MDQLDKEKTAKLNVEKEKFTKQIQLVKDGMQSINNLHDTEVKNVFDDEKTLFFIQKMRGFKKTWQDNKAISKRKQVAGQMAEATKNWISSYE